MRPRFAMPSLFTFPLFAALLIFALHAGDALAHEDDPAAPNDLAPVAHRITGGASLLQDLIQSSATKRFHQRAHHFEEVVGNRGGRHLAEDWRKVRAAFQQVRRERRGGETRYDFLMAHLGGHLADGDALVGRQAAAPPPSGRVTGSGRLSFIDRETCVGTKRGANSCKSSSDTLTFSIPRDVAAISRLNAEWRDFDGDADGEIYVNDRLVWHTALTRDWDTNAKSLDVRIPPGSTLSIRSSNGDPIWIRRLSAETLREGDRDQVSRSPWDFLWPDNR